MQKDGISLLEYLVDNIERLAIPEEESKIGQGLVDYNEFSACMSDDGKNSPDDKHMTMVKFKPLACTSTDRFLSIELQVSINITPTIPENDSAFAVSSVDSTSSLSLLGDVSDSAQ